eukprot:Tbor_TRINITY_DN2306_c0_g1::TRINITY_DN2306_c0_g1_i1::g.108::m.108/K12833/SF3B14; pre-mRNA branch site protein p14
MLDDRILLVTNLPRKVTSSGLFSLFGGCGPLRQVRLGTDTPFSKGSAIVVYDNVESAQEAVRRYHGETLGSVKLHVEVFDAAKLQKRIEKKQRQKEREQEYREKTNLVAA